jgi:predicted ester cyclase
MPDAVLVQEELLELAAPSVAVVAPLDENVRRERGEPGGDRPDVEVVDLDDARSLGQAPTEPTRVDAGWRTFEQDVHGVTDHAPGACEDEDRDQGAGERIGVAPAGEEDDERRDEHPGRAECIGEHVPERRAHVQRVVAAAMEDRGRCEVDSEARDRNERNPAGQDFRWIIEPAPGLDEDPDREHDEHDAVRKRCEDLGALIAEAPLGSAGPAREPDGDQSQRERQVVREHVSGIREQGEAAGQQAADDLDRREGERETEHDPQHVPISRPNCAQVGHGLRICAVMDVRELMKLEVDPVEVNAVYELWKQHSKAEDDRDIAGLLATLTNDCVYEIVGTSERWEGHEGATRFYLGLLSAFPDIHFDLTDIVVGPQGVVEEARVTGTHEQEWIDLEPSGERVEFTVVIFFPWDRERRLFRGEKVYVHADGLHL